MPTSSSSAEEPKPKARRKTKAPAKKKAARKKKKADAPELFTEDDFGDGLESSAAEAKPKKKAARKKTSVKRTRKRAEPEQEEFVGSKNADTLVDDTASVMEEARQARFDRDDEPDLSDIGDYFSAGSDDDKPAASGSSDENRGENQNDKEGGEDSDADRPRRRRRRRRRGRGGSDNTEGSNERGGSDRGGSSNNSNNNSGGRGRGRGRQSDRSGSRQTSDRGGRQSDRGGRQSDRGGRGRGGGGRGGGPNPRRGRSVLPAGEPIEGTFEGVLEMHPKGYGFLRDPKKNYAAEDANPFVSSSVIEKYGLREGVLVKGEVGPGTRNQGPRLQEVELIDAFTPEEYAEIKNFEDLTPINPHEQIKLEVGPTPVTMRVMDLLCPIGKGQRALLVAPPRTGKTMLLQDIANSVSINHPEIHLMVLLIDERPEEVTEMSRSVNGEVIASSLDNDVESHVRIAQLIIERGKRLAEEGQDVFILLDSITRLARAFNKWVNPSGRTGRGGLDIRALDVPKKLFGTARRFDEGGSLTVCGTALVDTNNGMDEAIFQEFKGTGNMEMMLSRDLADRRIWPSIDITRSGTRREEKILDPTTLEGVTVLRRSLISLTPVDAMEQLTKTLLKFDTNTEFLSRIKAVL